ncbi:uncharacterized protein KY384_007052 [Bacidia gigantensis]|uniref:uncharacterized protein n=1 Tax=Bacidia gigantensis TaxID=2732470 RepID=UPI001D056B2D|nr:uncharacterized protein KY384_007052 [Bacidia gigantensis]KAG8528136.1 hypothetical protein KY384_007052 [Bacidia gigantensis]
MSPPSATETLYPTNGDHVPSNEAPLEPGISKSRAMAQQIKFPEPPSFTNKYEERHYLKGRLAAAFRIFGKYGFDEGVAGHITLRDPVDPSTFWVNPFGVAFSLIKRSDLIQVNHHGEVIDGGKTKLLNTAAFMIHGAIHHARPDVLCADSCAFYDDIAHYSSFNGIVLADTEGKEIARALGGKKAALLQNHGLLTVGDTIEGAVFWFVSLEKCCHAQLMADAAAGGRGHQTVKIDDEDAAFTYKTVGTPRAGWFSAKPLFDVVAREYNEDFLD